MAKGIKAAKGEHATTYLEGKGYQTFEQVAVAILTGESDGIELSDYDRSKYELVEKYWEIFGDCGGFRQSADRLFRQHLNTLSQKEHGCLAYNAPQGTFLRDMVNQIARFYPIVFEAYSSESPETKDVRRGISAQTAFKNYTYYHGLATDPMDAIKDDDANLKIPLSEELRMKYAAEARHWYLLYAKIEGFDLPQKKSANIKINNIQIVMSDDHKDINTDTTISIDHYQGSHDDEQ